MRTKFSLFILFSIFLSSIFAEQRAAIATIHPANNSKVHGTVTFTESRNGVRVTAEINGLSPGKHGFHIHEYGNCSAPNASSAGGHFNPTDTKHGCLDSDEHHVGDLGNITAGRSGYARYDRTVNTLQLEGPNSIIGRAVIIHEKADDCTSQPTGNAGGRVGCGVIGIAEK